MKHFRKHGRAPYKIVVVHGGPGAPGEVAPVARKLSVFQGVLEPFQTQNTINEQLKELHEVILTHAQAPVVMIGHSWGAWLSWLYSANYAPQVRKLILVSAGSFDEKYNKNLMNIRLNRLSESNRKEVMKVLGMVKTGDGAKNENFRRLAEIMKTSDSYKNIAAENEVLEFQPQIYNTIWREADYLRKSKKLLDLSSSIVCPVTAIHGDYDPHPAKGVKNPLSKAIENFKFIKLKKCGHTPWEEKFARDSFFDILEKEVFSSKPFK